MCAVGEKLHGSDMGFSVYSMKEFWWDSSPNRKGSTR